MASPSLKIRVMPTSILDIADVEAKSGQLVGRPVFYGKGVDHAQPLMLVMEDEEGEVLSRWVVRVNPQSFKMTLQDRSEEGLPVGLRKGKKTKPNDTPIPPPINPDEV